MESNKLIAKFTAVIDRLDQKGIRTQGLILSHPGFGKTSTIRKYCEYMDYNLVTLIPSQSSSDDILGIQSVQDGRLVRLTPSWFNRMKETMKNGKRTLLFIDEISTCDPFIQGPLLDLVFSHNLGEQKLPENVFIMSAGNYAEDLNSEFQLSAPLVNRFLLLNLGDSDYSIAETLSGDFNKLETREDIEDYLGLKESTNPLYSFDKFKEWIHDSNEIGFKYTAPATDPKHGLIGFTSMRSLTYALQFAEEYFNTFADNLWFRMVGDTLGYSANRANLICLTEIFDAESYMFQNAVEDRPLQTVINEIIEGGLTDDLYEELTKKVLQSDKKSLTTADVTLIQRIASRYRNRSRHWNFLDIINHLTLIFEHMDD